MNFKLLFLCGSTVLLWSSAFVGIQVVMRDMQSGDFVLYRLSISAGCLWLISCFRPSERIVGLDRLKMIGSGFLGSTSYCLFLNAAQPFVTSAESCLVINTMPIFVAVLSWVLLKTKIGLAGIVGLCLSMCGVGIMALAKIERDFQMGLGVVYLLGAALSMALGTLLQKDLLQRYSPLLVIGRGIFYGAIAAIPTALGIDERFMDYSWNSHALVWYLAIFPSALAYLGWGQILKALPTHKAASVLYLVPLGTTIMATFTLGEVLSLGSLLGGGFALLGVMITQCPEAFLKRCYERFRMRAIALSEVS